MLHMYNSFYFTSITFRDQKCKIISTYRITVNFHRDKFLPFSLFELKLENVLSWLAFRASPQKYWDTRFAKISPTKYTCKFKWCAFSKKPMYFSIVVEPIVPVLYTTQDTGSVLMPTDIKYYQMFGGRQVIFEKEEVNEIKDFGTTGNNQTHLNLTHKIVSLSLWDLCIVVSWCCWCNSSDDLRFKSHKKLNVIFDKAKWYSHLTLPITDLLTEQILLYQLHSRSHSYGVQAKVKDKMAALHQAS